MIIWREREDLMWQPTKQLSSRGEQTKYDMVVARIKRREELMWQPQLSSKGEQTDVA